MSELRSDPKERPPSAEALAELRHELRTPLNHIIGYCEMLIEDAGDAEDGRLVNDLTKVLTAGRHLLGLC